jgi:hypothetical protein
VGAFALPICGSHRFRSNSTNDLALGVNSYLVVPWNQIAGHLAICNRKSGLGECIGDNALIKKAATSELAAITCPSSRFYSQLKFLAPQPVTAEVSGSRQFRFPEAILHGDIDKAALLELTERPTHELIASSRLLVYEDAAHALPYMHTDRMLTDIVAFAGAQKAR